MSLPGHLPSPPKIIIADICPFGRNPGAKLTLNPNPNQGTDGHSEQMFAMIVFSNSNTVTELFIVRPYYRETEGAPQNNHRSVSLPGVHIQNETEMFSVGDRSSFSSVGSLFYAHSAATEIAVLPIRRCVVHGRARPPLDETRNAHRRLMTVSPRVRYILACFQDARRGARVRGGRCPDGKCPVTASVRWRRQIIQGANVVTGAASLIVTRAVAA